MRTWSKSARWWSVPVVMVLLASGCNGTPLPAPSATASPVPTSAAAFTSTPDTSAEPTPTEAPGTLEDDFEIVVYQGADVLGGEQVRFSEVLALAKPVVVSVWAGLCPICRQELPYVQGLHEEYGNDVLVLAVDIGSFVRLGDEQDARALIADLGLTMPAGRTLDASLFREYQVLSTPSKLFFLPDGTLFERHSGPMSLPEMEATIEAMIEVAKD